MESKFAYDNTKGGIKKVRLTQKERDVIMENLRKKDSESYKRYQHVDKICERNSIFETMYRKIKS